VKLYFNTFPRSLKHRPIYPQSLYICMTLRRGVVVGGLNCVFFGRPRLLFSITTLLQLYTSTLCKVEREVFVSEEAKMIQPRKAVLRSVTVGAKKTS
jgi:uncharacterized membrane protein YoaK (UPF0700 family)